MKIHSLGSEMNTSNLNPKLRVTTVLDKKTSAHRIDIYYNAQLGDKRMLRRLEIDSTLVHQLYKFF
jgi:hypothetical protein